MENINKQKNLSNISKICLDLKKRKKKIILCHGVFDLFHVGHVKYLNHAKKYADYLIVSITTDRFVNKGFGRPIFNQNQRAELLSSLSYVDYVVLSDDLTAIDVISSIKPDYYAKGIEYKNFKKDLTKNIVKEIKCLKKNKGKIVYIDQPTFSSSSLINNSKYFYNNEQKNFLKKLKSKYSFEKIIKYVNQLYNLKTMVIGETIIDEYVYSRPLGKSGKEPYLAFNEIEKKLFLGGAAAVTKQLNEFVKNVSFVSMIGKKKEYFEFIKKNIPKKIKNYFLNRKFGSTILKKRYVDEISNNKVFGSYLINTDDITQNEELEVIKNIKKKINKIDLILVSDYGHGFITNKISNFISSSKKFLALNAQVNAANIGFHTLKKYKKINALIINETELRHELRNKHQQIDVLAKKLISKNKIDNLVVTSGITGSIILSKNKNIISCPAFARSVIDKVGAGDSMLSIISVCLKCKIPNDLTIFLASLMAAFSVENVANEKVVNKTELLRTIEFMYK